MLSTSVYATDVGVELEGVNIVFTESSGSPFIDENNRVLVPFRLVLEAIGANVRWESQSRIAVGVKDGVEVAVPIGQTYILKNNEKILNDTYARIVDGRTYLPIRVVVEAFGYDVGWDAANKKVLIAKEIIDGEPVVEDAEEEVEKTANIIGNSNGNLVNQGVITQEFDTIYYVNFRENQSIYSYNLESQKHEQLTEDPAKQLNVVNGTLYFLEESLSNSWDAYQMNVDGTEKEQIGSSNVNYIGAFEKGVYYYNVSEETLYFLDHDKPYSTKVLDETMTSVQIVDEYLYFVEMESDSSDNNDEIPTKIIRVDLESKERKTILEERIGDDAPCYIVTDEYIFYCRYNDAYSLYRSDLNGDNVLRLTDDRMYDFNTDGEYVYYLNPYYDEGIIRIKSDGSERKKIMNEWNVSSYYAPYISIFGDDIFYRKLRSSTKYDLYRVEPEKAKVTKIQEPIDLVK